MYVDDSTSKATKNNKTHRRVLLRNSYRHKGKVCHDTIGNISSCSDEEIEAIKLALKHKGNLKQLVDKTDKVKAKQKLSVGAIWVLLQIAKHLGIIQALGTLRYAKLVLWMIFATIIEQGSRLSAVRLARQHAVCDVLNLDSFNEDDLYAAMDWLQSQQEKIEKNLFKKKYGDKKPVFYLYDVTSSYLEGDQNELGDYGYNRDGKKGKKQIVIGLMTDDNGWPITVEVFQGNTKDTKTFKNQIEKVAHRFGVEEVVFVGDRGMIKSGQIKDLHEEHFKFITAITKPQIESLIKNDIINMSLFDHKICEVIHDKFRYILRRNPIRQQEIEANRQSRLTCIKNLVDEKNNYLREHPRAKLKTAINNINKKINSLKLNKKHHKWLSVKGEERKITLEINDKEKTEISKLDGCYVIKSDLLSENVSKETIHSQYKGLADVEWAFRTMKTTLLEMRGIFVRKENRTRAHVFIIMLAYMIAYQLRMLWYDIDITVEEGIKELASICGIELTISGHVVVQSIPEPREQSRLLLEKAKITLPDVLPCRNVKVDTRKKLTSERKLKKFQNVNP